MANYSPEFDLIDVFYSPTKALDRMTGAYEVGGIEAGRKSSIFQPVREAWAAAVFLLGYSQITETKYWLRENPKKNEAPDVFAISFREPTPEEKGVSREVMEIEVCEYDENAKTELPEHLRIKLAGKNYNEHTFLLCYIHKPGGKTRLIDVINGLKGIKTTVREVWLLMHLGNEPLGNFLIARVYLRDADLAKTNLQYKGDYKTLSKLPQQEMVKTIRGSGRKVEFSRLGVAYVPLPKGKSIKK